MSQYFHDLVGTVSWYSSHLTYVIGACLALELILPLGKVALKSRIRAFQFWCAYIAITASFFAFFGSLWASFNFHPLIKVDLSVLSHTEIRPIRALSYVAIIVIAMVFGDFFYYWFHRLQHTSATLWRFHEVHHSIRDMNALNSAHHWTEEIFRIPFVIVPTSLLINCDTGYIPAIIGAVMGLQGIYEHSATRIHLGWFRYIIPDNRFHRMHHSVHEKDWNKNFGSGSSIWDVIFRTANFPKKNEWPAVGLRDTDEPATLREYLFMPFRRRRTAPSGYALTGEGKQD